MLGFLQAVYALEGAETAAQVAEEAKRADWLAPLGIASSIAGSWLIGVICEWHTSLPATMLTLRSPLAALLPSVDPQHRRNQLLSPHQSAVLRCSRTQARPVPPGRHCQHTSQFERFELLIIR